MKLNGSSIKSFFLHHGEKLVFAVVAAVLAGGGYSLVSHETYQKEPDELVKKSNSAREYVRSVTWDAAREQVVVIDPNKAIDEGRPLVKAEEWRFVNSYTSGGSGIGKARPQPELLPPIELEVSHGFGPIALNPKEKKGNKPGGIGQMPASGGGRGGRKAGAAGVDVPPNSEISGYHFVCLRAVVPAKEQSDLFAKAFLGARFTDPKTDELKYVDFVVERAKVNPSDPTKLDWQPIKSVEVNKVDRWPKTGREVVAPEALDAKLTSPLPPLLTRDWGFEVAHARWPVLLDEPTMDETATPENSEEGEDDAEAKDEPTDEDEDMEDAEAPRQPRRPQGGGVGMAGGPGMTGMGIRTTGAPHDTGHAPNEDFLFRFFDFTVKPKEHYVYRVALKVANPNYDLNGRHLENPDLAKDRALTGPISAPSREIEIPGELYFRVGEAKPGRGSNEPTLRAMVVVLDNELGILVSHKEEKVARGQVMDFPKQAKSVENPKTGEWEEKAYNFNAGAILIDMKGGPLMAVPSKRGSKMTEPGEGLFLDKNGQLVSHRELLEAQEFDEFGEATSSEPSNEAGGIEMPDAARPGGLNPFDEVIPKGPKKGTR